MRNAGRWQAPEAMPLESATVFELRPRQLSAMTEHARIGAAHFCLTQDSPNKQSLLPVGLAEMLRSISLSETLPAQLLLPPLYLWIESPPNKSLALLTQHLLLRGPDWCTSFRCCYQNGKSKIFYVALWGKGLWAITFPGDPDHYILGCDCPNWYICPEWTIAKHPCFPWDPNY